MDLLCVGGGGILGAIIHSVFNLSGGAKVNLVVSSNYLQFKKEKKDFAFGMDEARYLKIIVKIYSIFYFCIISVGL